MQAESKHITHPVECADHVQPVEGARETAQQLAGERAQQQEQPQQQPQPEQQPEQQLQAPEARPEPPARGRDWWRAGQEADAMAGDEGIDDAGNASGDEDVEGLDDVDLPARAE